VRREIYDNWEKLGLSSRPNVGDNGAVGWATACSTIFVNGSLCMHDSVQRCGNPRPTLLTM